MDGAGYVPIQSRQQPLPQWPTPAGGSGLGPLTQVGQSAGQIWPKGPHPIGYTEQWSMDLQYQVGNHSVFEVGYTGVRGQRLMYGNPDLNANQLPTQDLALGQSTLDNLVKNPFLNVITDPNSGLSGQTVPYNQLLRPFPEFGSLQWARSLPGAHSAYDALSVKFTKQFSQGSESTFYIRLVESARQWIGRSYRLDHWNHVA